MSRRRPHQARHFTPCDGVRRAPRNRWLHWGPDCTKEERLAFDSVVNAQVDIAGNAFIEVKRDDQGEIVEMWLLSDLRNRPTAVAEWLETFRSKLDKSHRSA